MTFSVETEQETDGRWIAEIVELSGAMACGNTRDEAVSKVQALALRVVADRLEYGEAGPSLLSIAFQAATALGPVLGLAGFSLHWAASAG